MNKNLHPVLETKGLCKTYDDNGKRLSILKNIDLRIMPGEFVAIVGSSGSGKSTLLHCLGGLDLIDSGSVWVDGENLFELKEKDRTIFRNQKLGFVYQFHHLLAEFSALENVSMPLRIRRLDTTEANSKALQILEEMGLKDRASHLPSQLSGGERQRVAIARAIVSEPVCLLADEPTGNLDDTTAKMVIDHLLKLIANKNIAVVIVTHDMDIASRCDRILHLKNGQIFEK